MFSNRPERISKSCNLLTGMSDHNLILVFRKLSTKLSIAKEYESFRIPKNQLGHFKNSIHDVNWDELLLGEDSMTFSSKVQSIIAKFTRKFKQRNKKNRLPWIDTKIPSSK